VRFGNDCLAPTPAASRLARLTARRPFASPATSITIPPSTKAGPAHVHAPQRRRRRRPRPQLRRQSRFERAVFRLIGYIAIASATFTLLSLLLDVISIARAQLPDWWIAITDATGINASFRVYRGKAWFDLGLWRVSAGWLPLFDRLAALLLLAGGIGCLRSHTKTRLWMISFAICSIVLTLAHPALATYEWVQFEMRMRAAVISGPANDPTSIAFLSFYAREIGSLTLRCAFPIILLYLMTRPYVAMLFAKDTR
jgi:hypothetical protein